MVSPFSRSYAVQLTCKCSMLSVVCWLCLLTAHAESSDGSRWQTCCVSWQPCAGICHLYSCAVYLAGTVLGTMLKCGHSYHPSIMYIS